MPPRELTMPKLSDSMADAVIIRWLKAAGEDFARGEGLVEGETDKATVRYGAGWGGRRTRADPRGGGGARRGGRADCDPGERRRCGTARSSAFPTAGGTARA